MESGTETKTVKPAGVAGTWWPAGDGAGEVGRVWDPWRPDGGGHRRRAGVRGPACH